MSRKAFFISELLPSVLQVAREAGALIMKNYNTNQYVDRKEDASPVTEADRAADRLIVSRLQSLAYMFPVVSEEGDQPDVSQADYFWLVDPLDGTKSFIRGSGYFTVNIALIGKEKLPVLGVIYDPVHDCMYWGTEEGVYREQNGIKEHIQCRIAEEGVVALVSHSHLDERTERYLATQHVMQRIPCASSIKFCWLAEGRADIYPRFGPTMEWDTAAGHAILLAAGGHMVTPEGLPFLYGKPGFRNGYFIASGRNA